MANNWMLDILNEEYSKCNYGNDDYWSFSIKNIVFTIIFSGGSGYSIPEENLKQFIDYKTVSISIYENKKWKSMSSSIAVSPKFDSRFKDKDWAGCFNKALGFVSPDVACDIVKYCDNIINFKSFW